MLINRVSLSFPISKSINNNAAKNEIIDPLPPKPDITTVKADSLSFGFLGRSNSVNPLLQAVKDTPGADKRLIKELTGHFQDSPAILNILEKAGITEANIQAMRKYLKYLEIDDKSFAQELSAMLRHKGIALN